MSRKTIYDIAQKAEVSIATVSRVINNRPEISDETRQKVLTIADEMGYECIAFISASKSSNPSKKRIEGYKKRTLSNHFFTGVYTSFFYQST